MTLKTSLIVARSAVVLLCVAGTPLAQAASEEQKVAAIQKGLGYLYTTQQTGGHWNFSGEEQAATGAAAFAFLSHRDKWGDNAIQYQAAIDKAVSYLLATANTINVSTRNDGVNICPGTASCRGVYWFGNAKSTYATGLVAPAIVAYGAVAGANVLATSSGPLAGMTWGQIAQGITNALAAAQSTRENGNRDGGWGSYIPGNGDADSFSTHSAVTAFIYSETLGAITPDAVRSELKSWLGSVQDPSGAVCHQPGIEPCTHAATGGWLLAMKFAGYDLTNTQVQAALSFLNPSWQSAANNESPGNFGHPWAMWALYQGLGTTIGLNDTTYISNRLTDCGVDTNRDAGPSGKAACTWAEDYNQWLMQHQKADGSWGGYSYWTDPLAGALYVNILGAIRIPLMAHEPLNSGTPERTRQLQQIQLSVALGPGGQTNPALPAIAGTPEAESAAQAAKVRPRKRRGASTLAIDGSGGTIASSGSDNRIRVFSTTTGQQRQILAGSPGLPTGLSFSRDGVTLSGVGKDSLVRIWNASSGAELAKLAGHEHPIRAISASPDDKLLATAGEETRILLWNLTTRKLSKILFGPTDFVNALSFNTDGRLLASATEDARVLIFDVASGRSLFTLRGHSGPIDTAVFSPDGAVLATGGQDTVIHLWDPVRGVQRQALRGHAAPIRTIAFSPDGRLIASGGEDTQIRLWNSTTGVLNRVLTTSGDFINVLVFDPRGNFLVSASEAGEITLWNLISGTRLLSFRLP